MTVYRIDAAGFAHGHIFTLLKSFTELPNVEWVACADTVPATPSLTKRTERSIQRMRDLVGPVKAYNDYREMLDKEQLDIVVFCPENARHGEVAEAIAAGGTVAPGARGRRAGSHGRDAGQQHQGPRQEPASADRVPVPPHRSTMVRVMADGCRRPRLGAVPPSLSCGGRSAFGGAGRAR
mgnify:CR=1 FL=1